MPLAFRNLRLGGAALLAFLGLAVADAAVTSVASGGGFALLGVSAHADDDGGGGGGGGGRSSGGGAGRGGGGNGGRVIIVPNRPTIFDAFEGRRARSKPRRPRAAARRTPRTAVRQVAPPTAPQAAAQAVPRELLASGLTADDLTRLRAAGFEVLAERRLAVLPEITARLRLPRGLGAQVALRRLRGLAPGAVVDLNHLYRASNACAGDSCFSYRADAWPEGRCVARGTIGLIDTGVDRGHPAFAGQAIETETLRGPEHKPSSQAHGTEIALLLTGGRPGPSGVTLVAIDAFHSRGGEDFADAFDLVAAIDRLVARAVPVANLSLAGPANALVQRAGAEASVRGMILVAAVGNRGPKAGPQYPAAFPWAIAVTAIDRKDRVYARAGRGAHVAFAAPGVRVQLPDAALGPGAVRSGTSYAAPLVAAALSARIAANGDAATADVVAQLAAEAGDLGAPGRDPVYGWGEAGCR